MQCNTILISDIVLFYLLSTVKLNFIIYLSLELHSADKNMNESTRSSDLYINSTVDLFPLNNYQRNAMYFMVLALQIIMPSTLEGG